MVGVRIGHIDLPGMAREANRPTLIVHDQNDDEIPPHEGMTAWPGARQLVTERYGHRRILIAREVAREVIGFLKAGPGT